MTLAPVQASFTSSVSVMVAAGLGGNLAALGHADRPSGIRAFGAAGHEVQAQLRAHDHERVRPRCCSASPMNTNFRPLRPCGKFSSTVSMSAIICVGWNSVGQAVPHRHAGVGGQLLDDLLGEAAVLDAVVHAAEHAGGVLDGLLLAHLGAAGIEVGDAHAQVHARPPRTRSACGWRSSRTAGRCSCPRGSDGAYPSRFRFLNSLDSLMR